MLVTCAIIINKSNFFVAQRPLHKKQGGKWEFPGGKVGPDETLEQCIKREISEELNIDIEIKLKLPTVFHKYDDLNIELVPFVCEIKNGDLELTEHINSKWINIKSTVLLDFCEADRKILPTLEKVLHNN